MAIVGSSSSSGASDDTNRTTNFTYTADGLLATITAVNAATGDQTTTYQHGTTLSDSGLASSHLKRYEIYPDSTGGSDRKAFAYNRQAEVTSLTDQNGTVHSYDFDLLGRTTADRITTSGSGIDIAVLRIGTTYEVRGLVQNITSYDNATVGSGNVVNDVQKVYNAFGQLVAEYQSHAGAVNVSSTPNVQYAYADGSANTIRPTSLTYPNGRVLTYDYGPANGIDDAASRIASLIDNDGVTHLGDYSYLGAGTIIQVNEPEPAIQYTLVGIDGGNDPDTGDIYRGLDRFGRVKDLVWAPTGGSSSSSSSSSSNPAGTDLVRIQHGYDRAGNRLWRKDPVAASYGAAFDELYGYDGLYRLTSATRGTLNATQTALQSGSETFAQCWTLDSTGNWSGFREDDTGDGTWDLIQARSANPVNEISGITNSTGPTWVQPAYDKAGNMTTIPQPADPTKAYTGTYDSWNRLVKLVDAGTGSIVQRNAYDGRNYRIIRNSFASGTLTETRHYFDTADWQSVEERVGASANAERQFVWGLRFIDDVVLRDRDTTGGGTPNERLYAIQDPLGSVVAVVVSSGIVQERSGYAPYGAPTFLAPAFVPRSASSFDWETLFAGYGYDAHVELYPVRNRVLNAFVGWLQRDPLGLLSDTNVNRYVGSRPVILTDPSGLRDVGAPTECFQAPPPEDTAFPRWDIAGLCGGDDKFRRALKCLEKCMGWGGMVAPPPGKNSIIGQIEQVAKSGGTLELRCSTEAVRPGGEAAATGSVPPNRLAGNPKRFMLINTHCSNTVGDVMLQLLGEMFRENRTIQYPTGFPNWADRDKQVEWHNMEMVNMAKCACTRAKAGDADCQGATHRWGHKGKGFVKTERCT